MTKAKTQTQPEPNMQKMLVIATRERDEYVEAANKQVAFLNGRIAMLEELINPQPQEEKAPGPGQA